MARRNSSTDKVLKELRKFGLAFPGAHYKSPWPGHKDLAVKDKTFCYLGIEGEPFSISCKLPYTHEAALLLPFTKPTGYGLGRAGWVSASFPDGKLPAIEMFKEWIDESYRAQAPKRLIKELDGEAPRAKKKVAKKKVAKTKVAKTKVAKKKVAKTKVAKTKATKRKATKKR